jgi:hypothetical protein
VISCTLRIRDIAIARRETERQVDVVQRRRTLRVEG